MRNLKKEEINTYLKRMAAFLPVLLYYELLLYYQLHGALNTMSVYNILFLVPIAALLAALTGWFRKRERMNDLLSLLILFVLSLFYLVDLIYYKTFGSLLSVSMLGGGEDAITNFGWSLKATLKENINTILLFEVPVLIKAFLMMRGKKEGAYRPSLHMTGALMAAALWALIVVSLPLSGIADHSAYGAYHSRFVDTDTASGKLGVLPNFLVELRYAVLGGNKNSETLQETENVVIEEEKEEVSEKVLHFNGYEDMNLSLMAKDSEDQEVSELLAYLDKQPMSVRNEYTGIFKDYNLIYICAESFSNLAIDEKVTPTLYKLANNGIVLKNYYNSFRNVTTNGEYAILTGLWPDVARQNTNMGNVTGTMGRSIHKDMSVALGNMFEISEGVKARAYHNYLGYYYGRNQTLPNMGFDCQFMNDGMKFTTAWPSSDLEMMEQSIDDYINDERFCTYYMTFSGHGNYTTDNVMVSRNIKTVKGLLEEHLPTSAEGYLSANYELEKAMTYLLERLEEAGKLDNTVIVLAGDHYPYYLTDAGYEALKGEKGDDFESFHSTCIIYNAGLKEKIEVDTPCCNVDILPTVYNLFGIRYDSRLYAGTDVFGNGLHIAQLYNKNFITENVKYNFGSGEVTWLIDTSKYSETLLDNYLSNAINTVKNRYAYSIGVEDTDLFACIFENYDVEAALRAERADTMKAEIVSGEE